MVKEAYSQHFVSSLSPSQAYSRGVKSVTLPVVVMVEVPTGGKGRLVLLDVQEAKEDEMPNHCKNSQSGNSETICYSMPYTDCFSLCMYRAEAEV
jgi:hypothetical protein